MASRADMTLVIRTRGLLLRADVSGDGEPAVTRWQKDWPEPGAAVAYAMQEGGKPGKRVWLLDSEVWLGVVDLPAGAVAGQSDKDLAGPAAYEAEALSDLSPTEAVTAVQRRRRADQGDQFLVTQARRTDVVAVAKAVRGAGSRLAGLGHPAGLPVVLDAAAHAYALGGQGMRGEAEEGGWRRVEFWADAVVLVESVAGRRDLFPLGVGPHSDWRRALTPMLRAGEPVAVEQTLIGPGVRVRGGTQWHESVGGEGTARWLAAGEDLNEDDAGMTTLDLAEDLMAERFARAWASELAAVEPGGGRVGPTLRAPKPQASRWPAVAVGVLALALAVFAVVALRGQASDRLVDLRAELAQVEQGQQGVGDRREQVSQAKADVRNKQRAVDTLENRLEQMLGRQASAQASGAAVDRRAALGAMMSSLSRSNSEATVIQSIEHGSPRHEIKGMATSPEAATRLARELTDELRGFWKVSPAQIEPEAGPAQVAWLFTITIEPRMNRRASR